MKTLLSACHSGPVIIVLVCLGIISCSTDEAILLPQDARAESTPLLKGNPMDTIMFNVLANSWVLSFEDSNEAVLNITVHPGYAQPEAIDQYGTSNPIGRGYEVLTALKFNNTAEILLLEGHQSGDYPHNYFFKLYPSIGNYPNLEFDLLYYLTSASEIKGVFYNRSGVATHFSGTR